MQLVTGHVFRVERKRGPVWYAKYRLPSGRQVQKPIGPAWSERGRPPAGHFTKRTADDWLRATLDEARRGTLPGMMRTGVKMSDAAAEWLRYSEHDRAVKKSTLTEYRLTADRVVRDLGDVPIEDVTPEMIERWKATLTLSNRSVAKYLVILHGIFKRAMKVWGLPRNPVVGVERPRYRVSDDIDAFSPEEVWALVRAAGSQQDAALFLTAGFTGLRMGELLALQCRDVDFAGEAIRVRHSYNMHGGLGTPKSGKVRSVPLVPALPRRSPALVSGLISSPTTISCSRMSSAGSWTPARSGIATRPLVRAGDYVRSVSTTFGTRSARWPCARPRCRLSRRGRVTPTSRQRCATSTIGIVATRRGFWRRRPRCRIRRRRAAEE